MSPIEAHLIERLREELAEIGVTSASIDVLSAEAENWRYQVRAAGRAFEIGFNHRERHWCRETTGGAEKHFVSNDHPKLNTSEDARRVCVRLLGKAILDPRFAPRDPPVL